MHMRSNTRSITLLLALVLSSCSATGQKDGAATAAGGSMYGTYSGTAPEPDPSRKISEQDCTKPIAYDSGNLRCN